MTHRDQMDIFVSTSTSASDGGPDRHGRRSVRSRDALTVAPRPKGMASRRARGLASNAIVTPAILAAVVGLWPSIAASQTASPASVVAVCAENFPNPTELACGAGSNTVVAGGGTTAIGVNALASANNATALGQASKATGPGSTALGIIANATGSWSTAVGNASVANNISSTAVGDAAKATANFSSAVGEHSMASGTNSTAVGGNSTASFANSMALGAGAATTVANQVAIGTTTNTYDLPGVTSAASSSSQSGTVSVVTSDPTGHLATAPMPASNATAWVVAGNNAVPGNFIGTTSPQPFIINTSGAGPTFERMRITPTGSVGIGTTAPTARTEISHSDLTPNTVALRISNTNPTGSAYSESAIGFNVSLGGTGPNPNYFATRIYSKYDGTGVFDGRMSMQVRNGTGTLTDVLNVKNGSVGINTIAPLNPLHVVGTVRLTLAAPGPAGGTLCYTGATASAVITSCSPSDARLKTNVVPLANTLDKLEHVRGVSFEWNDQYRALGGSSTRREIGVLAQEVEQVFPELVSLADNGYRRVDYDRLTAVLIEAVKELRKENDALKRRTAAVERAISEH
jgi:hypothetical protein